MNQRLQSSTSYPITFFMTDSADHLTGKTGLSPTVTLSKNGASFGAASGAVTEIGNGWYQLAGNATDRNTLGELVVHAEASGADSFDGRYVIVPWNPFDGDSMGLGDITLFKSFIKNKKYLSKVSSTWYLIIRNSGDTADILNKALKDKDGNDISDLVAGVLAQELASSV